jgi:CBS domain-containing protein
MQIREIMTKDLACCRPEQSLQEVARMMLDCDCGAIPIVDQDQHLVGIVTDRDITCRTVARGQNPLEMTAGELIGGSVICAMPEMDVDELVEIMEEHQIRRVPVVDASGCCCGIVSQADIALKADDEDTAELVREVSQPTASA